MSDTDLSVKDRIFEAAQAEFLERGYDGSRMQAIADRAQVNKAMLHYHFRSKDELFAQIFRNQAQALFPKVEAGFRQEPNFIRFVCRFVDLYISHLIDNPFLPSYLFQVSANHPELLSEVRIDFPRMLVASCEAAVKRKEVRPVDARQFIVSLLGMCVMPFVGRNLLKGALQLDDEQFRGFLAARSCEVQAYVVAILTPLPLPNLDVDHAKDTDT